MLFVSRSRIAPALPCVALLVSGVLGLFARTARAQDVFVVANTSNSVTHLSSAGANLGTFASTGLLNPFSLGFSPVSGDLFVASNLNSTVVQYNGVTGAFVQSINTNTSGSTGIAFDPVGNLLVSNLNTGTITRYDSTTGTFLNTFASGLSQGFYLTSGPGGDIFAAELTNNRILRFNGSTGALIGTFASTNVVRPTGLVFGPDGNLYVANQTANTITRYDGSTGTFMDTFSSAGLLNSPENLVFAADGTLLVANNSGNNVIAIRPGGAQSAFASGIGGPIGITIRAQSVNGPEPASLALLAFGTVTGGLVVRRRPR